MMQSHDHTCPSTTAPTMAGPRVRSLDQISVTKRSPSAARRPLHRLFAICVTLGVVAGCSSLTPVEPLEVTLADVKITEVTIFETTLVAKLRITNPNPDPISIDGGSFKLILDDKKVGTGTASESATVERLGSVVIDAVFHINNASALLRLQNILQEKDVTYGIRGSLFTQGPFGTRKIKIDKSGRLDLSDANPTQIEGPDLNSTQTEG